MNRNITHPYLVLLLFICSLTLSFAGHSLVVTNEYENLLSKNPTKTEDYKQAADPGDFIIRRKADFNNHPQGMYTDAQFKSDWKCCSLYQPNTTQIKDVDGKRTLANFYAKGTWGRGGGLNQLVHMNDSPRDIEEAYITYRLKFEEGFDWGLASKLPGVYYGTAGQAAGGGAGPDLGDKGASIRFLWRANGDLQLYVYHHNMPGKYGDTMGAGNFARFQANKWHELTMRVVSNDIGKANGIIQVWLDGQLVASVQNVEMRTATSPRFIEGIAVSTFMGGSDSRFAPDHDQFMFMDDFHVWQYSKDFLNANPTVTRGLKLFDSNHKLYTPLSQTAPINTPPTVAITSPTNNQTFTAGQGVEVSAGASDKEGKVTKVEFYNNNTLIGTSTNEPFKVTLANLQVGTLTLTAKAFDEAGASTVSEPITISVVDTNSPPTTKIITPVNNESFEQGTPIEFLAEASDQDGEIVKVEFFVDRKLIASTTQAPYSMTLEGFEVGTYRLTVRANDDKGASAVSDAIHINVVKGNVAPTVAIVSPAQNTSFEIGTAIEITAEAADADGEVAKVEFFIDNALVGTATAAPYNATVGDLKVGTYALTAKAFDDKGASTISETININVVKSNVAPTVAIVSPTQKTTFELGTAIEITAEAADEDGEITKVEFFVENVLVVTATAAPYTVTVGDLNVGTYTLTAKAFDDKGASKVSEAINVNVVKGNVAPTVAIVSPAQNTTFELGTAFEITAEAADEDGEVIKVEFFVDNVLMGTATAAPYTVTVGDFSVGSYTLTAKGYDDKGASMVSEAVNVNVVKFNVAPTVAIVSPAQNTTVELGIAVEITAEAADEDGEVVKVEFFVDNVLMGTATAAPYTVTVGDLVVGTYALTTKAFDDKGASTVSQAININVVKGNVAPTVAIVSPIQNTTVELGTAVEITAVAADEDGEVAKVDFFVDGKLTATATKAPYTITIGDLEVGTYSLTAKAFDDKGASKVSEAINVNVVKGNVAPTVAIVSPAQNTTVELGTAFEITAEAADEDGEITKVEFFVDNVLVVTATSAPYTVTVGDLNVGTYTLTAKAFDDKGASTVSQAINVNVVKSNVAPTVAIVSPAQNTSFEIGTAIEITAEAADEDGQVVKVEFFVDNALVGTATAAPYTVTVGDLSVGSYTLTAKAFDDKGASTVSQAINVNVVKSNVAPTVAIVSPAQNTSVEFGTAIEITAEAADEDGEVVKVEFFIDNVLVGTATAAPYTITVGNLEVGTYALTAKAFDDKGASTVSQAINVNVVKSNVAPTVAIVSPSQNKSFELGTAFEITAEAADEDGEVVKVEFFVDNALVGTATAAPYTVTVVDMEVGTYALTAKAYDEAGAGSISEVVSISIIEVQATEPWSVSLVSPKDQLVLEAGSDILLQADINDLGKGVIDRVVFYNGDYNIGTITKAPYSMVLPNAQNGKYVFTAVAYHATEGHKLSNTNVVTVENGQANTVVTLVSPADYSRFNLNDKIEAVAEVTGSDVDVANLEFYIDNELVGSTKTQPYAITLPNLELGSYELAAVAYNKIGVYTISEVINIEIGNPNIAPTVAIVSPAQNTSVELGTAIEITAEAADEDGQVVKVEFFVDNALVGTATAAPYTVTVGDLEVGTYALTAKAYDEDGASTVSEVISILVTEPVLNLAPQVRITSPTQNQTFELGTEVTISAEASDEDGEVVRVAFFKEKTLLATLTEAPYTLSLSDLAEGSHEFTVRATDDAGVSTLSEPVTITVAGPKKLPVVQLVSPIANEVFQGGESVTLIAEAIANEEELVRVAFYNGDFLLGTATAAPYSFTMNELVEGTYTFTAVAYNADGEFTVSAIVTVTVENGNPLTKVTLTNPKNNAQIKFGEEITVTAVTEGGEVSRVEFYKGDDLLGSVANVPYEFIIKNMEEGQHELTAVAYDIRGAFTVSEVVNIKVNREKRAPKIRIASPGNNANFFRYEEVEFQTEVESPDAEVAKIEFFRNSILIGTVADGSNQFTWRAGVVGNLNIRAIVTDEDGMTATSETISVRVRNNNPPQVSITSPANESVFMQGSNIDFKVDASDSDGQVKLVEYYHGDKLIGNVETAPFDFTWIQPAAGKYAITAKAFDDKGASSISAVTIVNVEMAEENPDEDEEAAVVPILPEVMIINPIVNQEFDYNPDIDIMVMFQGADDAVKKVEYYVGGNLIGQTSASPFGITWKNAPSGNHILVAKAIGVDGTVPTISDETPIKVKEREISRLEIVNPMRNAVFSAGSDIDIRVAIPTNGKTVSHVDYFRGNVQLGTSKNAPYDFVWKKVNHGEYSLVAKAVYTDGSFELSLPVNIKVVRRNQALIRLVSPQTEMEINSGGNLELQVEIESDDLGEIKEIEYLINGKPLIAMNNQPFNYIWKNIQTGKYKIEARGKDKSGKYHYSDQIEIVAVDREQKDLSSVILDYKIGPNPTSDYLHVFFTNLDGAYDFTVRVVSMTGVVHKEIDMHVDKTQITLDLTDLRNGAYVLQFISNGNNVSSTRFIKR